MKKLLIIDDDDVFREQLIRALKSREFEALSAAGLDAGLELAERERPDGVVLDLRMPTRYGLEVIRNLHTIVGRIVVLTGSAA